MADLPFDDRDGVIWLDGEMAPWREAKVHVLTHALHYASAVFEGERIYGGRIFKLEEHTERLLNSARLVGYEIPYTADEINAASYETVKAQNILDGYVRPIAWRGSEQMGVSARNASIHLAIAVWEWPSYFSPEARAKGLRLQIADWRRPAPETAPVTSKVSGLYMICTMAKHAAEAQGYDDALMLDWRGRVAEATGANIFFAKDGVLHTPVPDCFLDGITRKSVIGLARARQIEIIERAIMPEEMTGFDEAFLTGTAVEVTAISEIGPYRFEVGRMSGLLSADFDRLTGKTGG